MTRFELFCLIFYLLDAEWDETHDEALGDFLSSANPFLWEELSSADPAIFAEFCQLVPNEISLENSYQIALKYISHQNISGAIEAFKKINPSTWYLKVQNYLSSPHKQ